MRKSNPRWQLKSSVSAGQRSALPETNAPENWPSQKDNHLPTIDFQGQIVSSREGRPPKVLHENSRAFR